MDEPRALIAIHGPSDLKCHPFEKVNESADCLETQFTPHDPCDENHERQVDRIQNLPEAIDNESPERIRPRVTRRGLWN
jgi:hypothetical protein